MTDREFTGDTCDRIAAEPAETERRRWGEGGRERFGHPCLGDFPGRGRR